jgi:mono/diheme cytochrome c family protein
LESTQGWLPMWEMKRKVPQPPAPKNLFSVQESVQESTEVSAQEWTDRLAGQPEQRPVGASLAPVRRGGERENIVSRLWRFSPWMLGLLAAAPLAAAVAQNLDAGKSGAQIFSEVCSNCHRSPRELRSNPGASFLREHYTTGSEMASTMSAYLSGAATGAGAAQQRRPPGSVTPGATTPTTTTTRDTPAPDSARDPRRGPQTAEPKGSPAPPAAKGRPVIAEVKPVAAPPPPAKPALEEFEE